MSGWLEKTGGSHKNYQKRWFVLQGTTLKYMKKEDGDVKGTIELKDAESILISGERGINVIVPGRTYDIKAPSKQEAQKWVDVCTWRTLVF